MRARVVNAAIDAWWAVYAGGGILLMASICLQPRDVVCMVPSAVLHLATACVAWSCHRRGREHRHA